MRAYLTTIIMINAKSFLTYECFGQQDTELTTLPSGLTLLSFVEIFHANQSFCTALWKFTIHANVDTSATIMVGVAFTPRHNIYKHTVTNSYHTPATRYRHLGLYIALSMPFIEHGRYNPNRSSHSFLCVEFFVTPR
jgi:hypothetical protein